MTGVLLALTHHDRVRHITLEMPASILDKYILSMDAQFPILERLYIDCLTKKETSLILPSKLYSHNFHSCPSWNGWGLGSTNLIRRSIIGYSNHGPRHPS
jgi:hypothetical protein